MELISIRKEDEDMGASFQVWLKGFTLDKKKNLARGQTDRSQQTKQSYERMWGHQRARPREHMGIKRGPARSQEPGEEPRVGKTAELYGNENPGGREAQPLRGRGSG